MSIEWIHDLLQGRRLTFWSHYLPNGHGGNAIYQQNPAILVIEACPVTRNVVFLVAPPFELLDLTGPYSVFAEANAASGSREYALQVVSTSQDEALMSTAGLSLTSQYFYQNFRRPIDTLLVIGGRGAMRPYNEDVLRWIRTRQGRIRRLGSVCIGAFLLAATGLLDGRMATTHWQCCDQFSHEYPNIDVKKDPIFVKDGPFYSSAGVTAGIDLSLALVEEDLGVRIAGQVARVLVLYLRRPGGQAQFSDLISESGTVTDNALRDLPAWVRGRMARGLSVRTLARQVSMSPRTFARRFASEFHQTPASWVRKMRAEGAKTLLQEPGSTLSVVARRCGFRSVAALRNEFILQFGTTPKEYKLRLGS
jgi:transcriptional regulator GlxA family with amidase domain